MKNNFGEFLCVLRKDKNITQKELAKVLNTTDKSISRWERGYSKPDLEMIYQISVYYKIPFNKLIMIRVADENKDDKVVSQIISELSGIGNRRNKIIKICLIIALIVILFLVSSIIFTKSYNKFKVYKVYGESENIQIIYGYYVETRVRDSLYLGTINLKNIDFDTIKNTSAEIYYIDGGKEYLLDSYTSLDNIFVCNDQSYTKIDDLSDYFDNMYLRIKLINNDNVTTEYNIKLNFILDYTNNKIIDKNEFKTEDLSVNDFDYNNYDI